MTVTLTLIRRELGGFFRSFTGYLVITLVALLLGFSYWVMVKSYLLEPMESSIIELFFDGSFFFWLILLLASPVITMRTYAQERFTGTYESLMTVPVGDVQVVFAKYFSALMFFALMWLPLPACIWVISHHAAEPLPFDPGQIGATVAGMLLIGSLYMAFGCFCSSLTKSQIIAAMMSLTGGLVFFFASFLPAVLALEHPALKVLIDQLSMVEHMGDFVRGVVDTRHLVFYLSMTWFFLFLTVKVVEARRWK